MPALESNPQIPEGFIYKDKGVLQAKMTRFIGATAAKVHFVFDFDRTLTVAHADTDQDITSWGILDDHLPESTQEERRELFSFYRRKELGGTMTVSDAIEWWSKSLDIYAEHQLDLNAIEKDFLTRASIRPDARELFQLATESSIPTVILSAGIKEVIDLWSKAYAIQPSLVLSTALLLDEDRTVTGWDKKTLIHTLNKSEANHDELRAIRAERPYAIVVGDSIHDADMAEGDDTVLRIRIFDPRPDENIDIESERDKTFEHFDAMIENGTLFPLVELLKNIRDAQA